MSIRALALTTVCCGLTITMVSCSSDKDGIANAPAQPSHGQKSPHVLAPVCNSLLAVDRCPLGTATLSYDVDAGVLAASNLNDTRTGVTSTFLDAHNWHQEVRTAVPSAAGEQYSLVSYHDDVRQSRLDMTADPTDNTATLLNPTFDGGSGVYTVRVYNDGDVVAEQKGVQPGSTTAAYVIIIIIRDQNFKVVAVIVIHNGQEKAGAHIQTDPTAEPGSPEEAGACVWGIGGPSHDAIDFRLPDGTLAHGDEVRFIEEVDGSGRYPYHASNRVDVLSNLGTLDLISVSAAN